MQRLSREGSIMKWTFGFIFCLAIIVTALPATAAPGAGHCERLAQQRDAIHRQLRKGHSVAKARQLKERLRALRDRISDECR
jgi:hypothetical protein